MRKLILVLALVAACFSGTTSTAVQPVWAAPAALTVHGVPVVIPADLHDTADVERFLLAVENVQHSTSITFLERAPAGLRAAVTAAESRPAGMTQETSYGLAHSARGRAQELAEVGAIQAPATTTCGWAYKKITYTPGIITYYSLWLQTDFCWNGSAIIGTPYQTHGGSASWGWSYTTRFTTFTWFPSPTRFWSGVEATMHLGPIYNYPYINTYLYANGTVSTWWNSEN
jgi:hypothetical protein